MDGKEPIHTAMKLRQGSQPVATYEDHGDVGEAFVRLTDVRQPRLI